MQQEGYFPLQCIGKGRDAIVYLGWSERDNHFVAISTTTTAGVSSETLEEMRLLRDAQIRMNCQLPQTPAVIDVIVTENKSYVVSEVIGGVSIDGGDKLSFKRGLDFSEQLRKIHNEADTALVKLERSIQLFEQVLSGVSALHQNGLIHQDLKPNNILCAPSGEPHLIDFGFCISPKELRVYKFNHVVGTYGYIPPEMLNGETSPTFAHDVYSLGCLMYEALCGKRPFFEKLEGKRDPEMLLKYIPACGDPMPPIAVNSNIPEAINDICMKAMSRDPEKRYMDAAEFYQALSRAIASTNSSAELQSRKF